MGGAAPAAHCVAAACAARRPDALVRATSRTRGEGDVDTRGHPWPVSAHHIGLSAATVDSPAPP